MDVFKAIGRKVEFVVGDYKLPFVLEGRLNTIWTGRSILSFTSPVFGTRRLTGREGRYWLWLETWQTSVVSYFLIYFEEMKAVHFKYRHEHEEYDLTEELVRK
jgi:hypothetical protein